MSAYLITNLKVTNPEGFQAYRDVVAQTIADHGGEYVVADVNAIGVEGNPAPLAVVLKFPTMAALKGWYESPEYQAILSLRTDNSEGDLIFAEGLAES